MIIFSEAHRHKTMQYNTNYAEVGVVKSLHKYYLDFS